MNEKEVLVKDLNKGSAIRQLLKFALPLFASNMLQAVYNVVDMVVVGQFIGKNGMSGVAIGGNILMLMTFISLGFGNAGQVLISHAVGAKDYDRIRRLIGTLFTFLGTAAVVLGAACLLFRIQLLNFMNTPGEAWSYTLSYVVTCCFGLIFIYGYNIVSSILRGMGDSRHPFIFISTAAVLNTVLDLLFVTVFGLEVFGAALATVIAQGVSFISALVFLYRNRERFCFDFKRKSFGIDREAFPNLIKLGIPMTIQAASITVSKLVVNSWVNTFGVDYSAVHGVASKIMTISSLVATSFTTAGSAMVGQAIGAKKFDRVPEIMRSEFIITFPIFTALSALVLLKPDFLFRLFTSDAAVLALAVVYVPAAVIDFYGAASRTVAFPLITGSGFTKLNFAIAILDGLAGRIGMSYVLGFILNYGCRGLWIGEALSGFVPLIVGIAFYFSGRWRKNKS
ncbi:MAG: MATE family efflux transporter [Lachnospiraceae bacterium]|nr:MATE family efflux transporter [Lachnospiraceae bacterium]